MSRKPALTFAGALRILGKHESETVGKLDKLLGGTILAAGATAAIGSGALVPAALLAAVWGWVDQKNEATGLLRGLVGKLSDRLAGTKGVARRDLIIAAHSTIAAAAFFEVLEEHVGRRGMRKLALTDEEQRLLTIGERKAATQDYYDSLYWWVIPAPSPSRGFNENLTHLALWVEEKMVEAADFFKGLTAGASLGRVFSGTFRDQVLSRYESHYLALAEKAPEFALWAALGEHAATRHRLGELNAEVHAALESQGRALDQVQLLLGLVSDRGAAIGRQRAGLAGVNAGVLGQLIVPSDIERYDADVTFPTIERAFVTPHYRMAAHDRDSRPADEGWWSNQPVARDLELMFAAHFSSADSTSLPMLLLGHPGAGKSILTKVLAARLPPEEYTVVRVPLRSVSASAPIADQIQQALDLASNNRLQWQALSDQSDTVLVVLLDGLDELLQATDFDRSGYLREVTEFQRVEGEQNRPVAIVVTSRTVVADRVDVAPGATVVKLDEFDDDQVTAWLDEWRAANLTAIRSGTMRELTPAEALHQADLARQPLLLLMLALYAADPQSPQLDEGLSKSALYERIFDSFARREVRKHVMGRLRPEELERRVSEQVFRLAVAALAMFNRGVQSVRETDLRSDLAALTGQDNLRDDEGARLLGEFFFVHAAEATIRTTERAYEFLHATFGEYLVAQHVMGELAAMSSAAYGGRYRDRALNDEVLFALLSHHAWAARPSIGDFAKELFAAMSPDEQDHVRRAVVDLLGSFRQRRRSTEYDTYRPTPLDFVRQLAAYSANLTTLSIRFSDPETGFPLVGAFGDDEPEALANWRSTLSLWRSGLDPDSWLALLSSLNLEGGATLVDRAPEFASFDIPGADEYWTARVQGDDLHAARIRRGMALVDRSRFHEPGSTWADEVLPQLQAAVFSGSNSEAFSSLIGDPPENTPLSDVEAVGSALVFLLLVRSRELPRLFVIRAVQSLAHYPVPFQISPHAVLTIAYVHPEVLLRTPRLQNPAFYFSVRDALHAVLDHGKYILESALRVQWEELRTRLLGQEAPERYLSDPLGELFSKW
ncbi:MULTISPECIES: NACHT domain-containing protein [unclassified Saccharothrix]|uniref:NACHT domain-containing protein n=1 Tax=unclassified Saccharothrix TaxID=2593673 RepID=UPI00307FCDC6